MKSFIKIPLNLQAFAFVLFLFTNVHAQKNSIGVSILQDGQEIKITESEQEVVMKKKEFKLMFNSPAYTDKKHYATLVDAFADPKGEAMIKKGIKIEKIPYFAPGTGMATDSGKEYDCLYIDKSLGQCHYIQYQVDGDKRAKLEGQTGDMLRLSWTINKFAYDPAVETSIDRLDVNDLYLVVLNDLNLNGKVDEGEYAIIHIIFR